MQKPLYIAVCDECKRDKPIVIECMIGARLCGECQEKQNRISYDEMHAALEREMEAWLWDYPSKQK